MTTTNQAINYPPENKNAVENVIELIGNTPLIRLSNYTKELNPNVEVYIKAEWFNPGGSVKDRPALKMILDGISSGKLTKDKVIMDSSSGNTAIAYAMIGAALDYKVELVIPENVNVERKKILVAFGADIIYSDPLESSDGAIRLARKLYKDNPGKYFMPDQYNNPANPLAHFETTAPEIWRQTGGRVTHFLAGIGTSGTIMGTGQGLKKFNKDIKILAVEPSEPLHGLEGMKNMATSIVPGIYKESFPDEIINVSTEDAYQKMKELLDSEGIFVGHSGGAVMHGTKEYAKKLQSGVLVALMPDGGSRYLSGGLWW
jgi:cysteine synthase B